ncbi:hypothetical protein SELMODRAFT_175493 [Selaginella moellendorffii]|uniref:RING-type E3 ubiquitin transferase n=1 Tax=Selaginella moellendorffii TaxID=88036 RepID=D8RYT9_SELML|nr:probable E3 ubiquitin-protein ligase XBOS32 [Selaginella moellendorffii]EFJ22491.1 hypothetical protein SELMODRAFT_175493 [Selaginella moellendorffii]|eukprot:XP_002976231.1 probable E3 ubiquitin-protein ligase XBOS32 [Selaginella moellendorffii]
MGISFGCSASGERLVSAARDGDLEEAQALLQCNPRLAKYSTFGARNSPLHFAAMQGHNEIVTLLLEHGVDVDTRKYCGQTALMQSCRHGHWEVVQTLILYNANVNKGDYLNGLTALHFAALNGHARCLRLLVADYVPSAPSFWGPRRNLSVPDQGPDCVSEETTSLRSSLHKLINKTADGGVTGLHMASLKGHAECVHLLLDLGADVSALTFQYDTTVDMIGAGSSPLHYAACGGSIHCCQMLLARGANHLAINCNGWIPQQVAQVWGRHWLDGLLAPRSQCPVQSLGLSPFLTSPLMSIVQIARECGLGDMSILASGMDSCAVCLEKICTVAAEGCGHELCTRCALYLCSNGTSMSDPAGAVPCPLCRQGIVSFRKLPSASPIKDLTRSSALGLCTTCTVDEPEALFPSEFSCRADKRSRVLPLSPVGRSVTCTGFSTMNLPCGKYDPALATPDQAEAQETRDHHPEWSLEGGSHEEAQIPASAPAPDRATTPRSLSESALRSKSPKRGWLQDFVAWKQKHNCSSKPASS